ncbi:hypothetical protein TRAPUB_9759 [Trametes pubescens]|uniref:Uncharacterized protein n=1 Tax=Trametes pubescens TaxID=154538 RepID=A0A1M2W1K2_TRAPU|nr:hypothetical protein TRAPUB_9759 [Trametes pubescens]
MSGHDAATATAGTLTQGAQPSADGTYGVYNAVLHWTCDLRRNNDGAGSFLTGPQRVLRTRCDANMRWKAGRPTPAAASVEGV